MLKYNNLDKSYFRAGADLVKALKELDLYTCRILAVLLRHTLQDYKTYLTLTAKEIAEELSLNIETNRPNINTSLRRIQKFGAILIPSGRAHKKTILINPYFVDRGYNHGTRFHDRLAKYLNAALKMDLITEEQMKAELGEAYKATQSTGTLAEQNDNLRKQLKDFEEKVMTMKTRHRKAEELMERLLQEKDARINDLNAVIQILSDKLPDGMAREIIEQQLKNRKPDLKLIPSE